MLPSWRPTYPFTQPEPRLRSDIEYAEATIKRTPDQPINGLKGIAIVPAILRFGPILGFIPDYQNCVCLGVTRQLLWLWFDGENHTQEWQIGTRVWCLNAVLLNIFPQSEVTRTPCRLGERPYWETSERRPFLLFYCYIALWSALSRQYSQHFLLLSYGTYLLSNESVTEPNITEVRIPPKKVRFQNGASLCLIQHELHCTSTVALGRFS